MKYIQPEVLQKIKQIDLYTFFSHCEPDALVRICEGTYALRKYKSLKISNGLWHYFQEGIGGRSALDYFVKVEGLSFMEAAHFILGNMEQIGDLSAVKKQDAEKKRNTILLPVKSKTSTHAIEYLKGRGIDEEILLSCIKDDLLYESVYEQENGRKLYHVVFLGYDEEAASYAMIRGIQGNFRGEAGGSEKAYSFRLMAKGSELCTELHLFESAIDVLSYATILKLQGKDYRKYNLMALAGVYKKMKKLPIALQYYLVKHPETKTIILHFDLDETGRKATEMIRSFLQDLYQVNDDPPEFYKDVNDTLCIMKGLKMKCFENEMVKQGTIFSEGKKGKKKDHIR